MTNSAIIIDGRLVADPELRFTQKGVAVCNFRIARSDSEKLPDGSWGDPANQLFLTVNVWKELAEECSQALRKGMRVCLIGKLVTRQWESKEGHKVSAIEMNAFSVFEEIKPAVGGGRPPAEEPWGSRDNQPQQPTRASAGSWGQKPAQVGQDAQPPF